MGKAKIIYTFEKSDDKTDFFEELVFGKMEIARLAFTNDETEAYQRCAYQLKQLCLGMEMPVSILMDIQETRETREQIKENILFSIKENVDYVTTSFIHSGKQARKVRELLNENGGTEISLIVKIEDGQENEEIDAILEAADGVMVESDPCMLKRTIMKKAFDARKILITTTQMLDFRVSSS